MKWKTKISAGSLWLRQYNKSDDDKFSREIYIDKGSCDEEYNTEIIYIEIYIVEGEYASMYLNAESAYELADYLIKTADDLTG